MQVNLWNRLFVRNDVDAPSGTRHVSDRHVGCDIYGNRWDLKLVESEPSAHLARERDRTTLIALMKLLRRLDPDECRAKGVEQLTRLEERTLEKVAALERYEDVGYRTVSDIAAQERVTESAVSQRIGNALRKLAAFAPSVREAL